VCIRTRTSKESHRTSDIRSFRICAIIKLCFNCVMFTSDKQTTPDHARHALVTITKYLSNQLSRSNFTLHLHLIVRIVRTVRKTAPEMIMHNNNNDEMLTSRSRSLFSVHLGPRKSYIALIGRSILESRKRFGAVPYVGIEWCDYSHDACEPD